ncbi:MAG: peptidyl-prolyl cis-trans isomerase [Rhodospirillaceae bacterium]|jgi:cyclophilin family peptidyl-prolyl cis-trans isomerase|nr:peptidyl-prolyl cis-trans isomerase [Rhodospirillaceae bacterium]MBT5458070.1 peptidyl-prolyl cis-trans isomerase [Rhodospirillaceae bacterium]
MAQTKGIPRMKITTNHGVIVLELDAEKAPESTKNFQRYVEEGHYNGTVFHRVIPGFMIQGGGFEPGLKQKSSGDPIQNEADNGLKNEIGTVAMARTSDPHSATAQFFINTSDNDFLNHKSKDSQGWGYTVFGKVVEGIDVVKKIEGVGTHTVGPYGDVPVEDVIIEKIEAQ